MKTLINIYAKIKSEKGATLVYVALLLTVFFGVAAFAIDIGYQRSARNQLQNAADAAALAGARRLGENYKVGTNPVTTNVTDVAQDTADQNKVAGLNLAGAIVDTKIGTWTNSFTETSVAPNAVQVTTNATFSTFFAPIFGMNNLNSGAIACAAISGTCTQTPGLPLGIGKSWFTHTGANKGCTQIAVNKTGSSCAGWTNLSPDKFKYSQVSDFLTGKTPMPTLNAGDQAQFKGGTVEPIIVDLEALFNKMATGSPPTWKTSVVVYDDNDICQNPTGEFTILGFATITVTGVITTGNNKGLQGVVNCNIANQARGGCFYAGTYGTIPGLVK